jgi:tetratricopeptide (TPR) repeat protein
MSDASTQLDRLRGWVRIDPNNLSLIAELADALLNAGAGAEALPHIEHALQCSPGHQQFRFRRAVALRRSGRPDEARGELDSLLADGVDDVAVVYERADLALQLSDFEGCLRWAEQAAASPDSGRVPRAELLRVRALHYLGRIDEAIAVAERVLSDAPGREDLRAALATLYLDAERLQDAARLVAQTGSASARPTELECVGGYLALADENVSLAAQRFDKVLQARPNDGRALLGAGLARASASQPEEAIALLRRAAGAMPKHLGTLNALAWVQLLAGQLDAAEGTFRQALEADRNFAETHGGLAVVAALRGEAAAAQEQVRTAQRLDRNSFSAAYAAMLLRNGSQPNKQTTEAMLQFLAHQPAPGGGSLKDLVLRQARRLAAP